MKSLNLSKSVEVKDRKDLLTAAMRRQGSGGKVQPMSETKERLRHASLMQRVQDSWRSELLLTCTILGLPCRSYFNGETSTQKIVC